jgi:proton-translocating NADH-quinone oxidoreductase chain M
MSVFNIFSLPFLFLFNGIINITILNYIFIINFFAIFFLFFIPKKYNIFIKQFVFFFQLKILTISLILYITRYVMFSSTFVFQIKESFFLFNNHVTFSCDNISLILILLTSTLILFCLLISTDLPKFKLFSLCFLIIELFLFIVWTTNDLFIFYIFFESVLIPMFIIITFWGSRERKIKAAYLFFMYTVIGSILMLFAIIYVYLITGTSNIIILQIYSTIEFSEQLFLWLAFFLGFAVKIPMIPFHLWLPEAHVEAPTSGSVLLAGILLKLGSYGMLKFLNPIFTDAGIFFTPVVHMLSLFGVIYASLTALRQNDLKRIIAYASIAHMNLIVIAIFSISVYALEGSLFQMISHGLVSSLLFLMIGVLYDRSGTRIVIEFSGLASIMPTFATFFLLATIANMAFPGTSSFAGELFMLSGIFLTNKVTAFLSSLGIFLCSTYSIWLFNRIMCGSVNKNITNFKDLDYLDLFVVVILVFLILVLGLYPHYISSFIYLDILWLTILNI